MEKLYCQTWESPLGKIRVGCSGQGVRELEFGASEARSKGHNGAQQPPPQWVPAKGHQERGAQLARQAVAELKEYFAGRRRQFSVPLDLRGTAFQ